MIKIPENTTIIGELRSSGQVQVDGRFFGEGQIDGTLLLTKECVWIGKAVADTILIEGDVEGEVIAREQIFVGANANIRGSIISPSIKIAEGAKLNCTISMNDPEVLTTLVEHKPEDQKPIKVAKVADKLAEYRKKSLKSA